MWLAVVLFLVGCLAPTEDERLLTSPFAGRMTVVQSNPTAAEILSSRSVAGDSATTVLITANLGSQPGVSDPAMAIIAFKLEIDCEQALVRATAQQFYGRDGTLRGSVDLDNPFSADAGMTEVIANVCGKSANGAASVDFRTLEEYWDLVQGQIRQPLR